MALDEVWHFWGIQGEKAGPFRESTGGKKAMQLFSNLTFILFQVLVTTLHFSLPVEKEASVGNVYLGLQLWWFSHNRRSHVVSVKEEGKATQLLIH